MSTKSGAGVGTHWICVKWKKGFRQGEVLDSYKQHIQSPGTHGLCFAYAMMNYKNQTQGLLRVSDPDAWIGNARVALHWLKSMYHKWGGMEVERGTWVKGTSILPKIDFLLNHKYEKSAMRSIALQTEIRKLEE